jgi:PAS domain S-box-containing protein
LRGRLRTLAVLLVGVALSVTGFVFTREAYRRQIEAQFMAAARDRAESVVQGLQQGFEDVTILRSFFEASDDISRKDFKDFVSPILTRHPYIQAFQWLPEVTPRNRQALEEEARRTYPGFRYFKRDAAGQTTEVAPEASFHAVHYLEPYKGNEVILGYSTEVLGVPQEAMTPRQEALSRALRTGTLTASGRIRLLQETGQQFGVLVMIPVRGKGGHSVGLVQGVFCMGDLVQRATAFLEPKGVVVRLLDAGAPASEALLHEEPSPLPSMGKAQEETLHLVRTFELAGRQWTVAVTPAAGHFLLATAGRAWLVLLVGLAFSALLTGYVRTLLASESDIRTQVELRTSELARETESHLRDAQALRESEARFRFLIEVMGEGLWVLDAEGATTFVNRRMAEMLGYTADEMVGRSVFDFMTRADVAQAKRAMADRQKGQGTQHDFRFRCKDGSELWTILTGTPVLDERGQVVSTLGVVTDITERRRQEQAQLQSQKLESLGILAGGIAHDFNNLLTAMLGNVSLAQLHLEGPSPASPYLENVERTVQRATNLTRQMLAYSGKGRFMVGPLELNLVVNEMAHLLGVSISKKVSIQYELQEGLPVFMAEASQIQQVVMNLVTNASEAIGEAEGTVSIRTGTQTYGHEELAHEFPGQLIDPGPFVTLEVADTGMGMTAEVQARIFEPFFTTKTTGRGLGLSAMQGIVRGHHGGIRVDSALGEGSTFKLIFPAGLEELSRVADGPVEEGWTGRGTILVVDDEDGVRQVAADLLRGMGFDVLQAGDGLEALERFRECTVPIQVILMDLTMPHLDGVETFLELRRMDPHCRVILTSGYNEQEAVQEFIGKGLTGFLPKPFLPVELMQAVRQALEG